VSFKNQRPGDYVIEVEVLDAGQPAAAARLVGSIPLCWNDRTGE